MRLDFFIAHATGLSRKQAKRAIAKGEVTVHGLKLLKADTPISNSAQVYLNGKKLRIPGPRYFMLNKPTGFVCSTADPQHESVLNLINTEDQSGLHIVGRLDIDTTGLLLLSTDGQWSHRVASPKKQCAKTYVAELAQTITDEAVTQLASGVKLKGELKMTLPATVRVINPLRITLTITEGRYHQIKRMLAAVGNRVTQLHREQIGDIILDKNLALGQYRQLSDTEIASI